MTALARVPASADSPVTGVAACHVPRAEVTTKAAVPVPAVQLLLAKTGLTASDVDDIELNEAFATQVLACVRRLDLDPAKVNRDGGAIALGHPIGATGARILVTLLHGLAARGGRRGIATLCVSGGMGLAALVERVEMAEGKGAA